MDVHGHPLRVADTRSCATLLAEAHAEEGFGFQQILDVFPGWISQGILKGWVVEQAGTMLCCGASLFVSDSFAEMLYRETVSHIGAMLVRQALSDNSDPSILVTDTASTKNGLNILIFHSGLPPETCDEQTAARVKGLMMQGFLWLHSGYAVSRILVEAFDESNRIFYERSQFEPIGPANPERGSTILALTRERVLELSIHPLLPLFTNALSKCHFTAGEQSLLAQALEGHTDDELAIALNLSLSTIKKRWISIFERAHEAVPQLALNARINEQKRGPQKRHLLLRYLRNHPEELRPMAREHSAGA